MLQFSPAVDFKKKKKKHESSQKEKKIIEKYTKREGIGIYLFILEMIHSRFHW